MHMFTIAVCFENFQFVGLGEIGAENCIRNTRSLVKSVCYANGVFDREKRFLRPGNTRFRFIGNSR